jgi:hypothetical protein
MRSRFAIILTALFLLLVAFAWIYPLFDRREFSGLFAVLLGLPWIDHLPSSWLPLAHALNAAIVYIVAAALAWLTALLRRAD